VTTSLAPDNKPELGRGGAFEGHRRASVGFHRRRANRLDTTTAQGRLVFHMFGALAEFERSLIRERTQAGLAAARRAGRTGGRPPKLTDDDIEAAKAMLANPDIGVTQIAHRLGVSPATLYRYIPAARTANLPGVEGFGHPMLTANITVEYP
jgi:DNA invertase Pin-like site-specific DNA recombinase